MNTEAILSCWGKKQQKQPAEKHRTKMAVQETAAQLSMALKVQEYPTLKVNTAHTGTRPWFRVLQVPGGFGSVLKRLVGGKFESG